VNGAAAKKQAGSPGPSRPDAPLMVGRRWPGCLRMRGPACGQRCLRPDVGTLPGAGSGNGRDLCWLTAYHFYTPGPGLDLVTPARISRRIWPEALLSMTRAARLYPARRGATQPTRRVRRNR